MTLSISINEFQARVQQCDSLMATAHLASSTGVPSLPKLDTEQITIAAFLNFFIAWERFLEDALTKLMAGEPTISGRAPVRYVMPIDQDAAKDLVRGNSRYFDYANTDFVRNLVKMYFQDSYPFEPHMGSIFAELADLRTMRNSSAHLTTSTQRPLESLAQRIFSTAHPGISLYSLIVSVNPKVPGSTVYSSYRDKLLVTAGLIAQG
jgi:hypothetical protein